jgi:molecular chaperone GrpE
MENEEQPEIIDDLSKEQKLIEEKQELLEQTQRLQAEFDNFRKRIAREQEDMKSQASEKLLRDLLPIVDGLQLSLQHAKDPTGKVNGEELLTGIIMINEQLQQVLEHQGLEEIPTEGRFDPRLHEALTIIEQEGAERGAVLQTYQRGYLRNGKVFRAAKVSVAR